MSSNSSRLRGRALTGCVHALQNALAWSPAFLISRPSHRFKSAVLSVAHSSGLTFGRTSARRLAVILALLRRHCTPLVFARSRCVCTSVLAAARV